MTKWCQTGYIFNYITSLMILLKNAPNISISAKYNKNGVCTSSM